MKIALAIMAATVFFLILVVASLGLDDLGLRRQLARERARVDATKSELDGKMQSASTQLVLARAEAARLTNELAFPIQITQRKAATGGYIIQIFNSSRETLPVSVSYSNSVARKGRTVEFEL